MHYKLHYLKPVIVNTKLMTSTFIKAKRWSSSIPTTAFETGAIITKKVTNIVFVPFDI